MERLPPDISFEEFKKWLKKCRVPFEKWIDPFKNVMTLYEETTKRVSVIWIKYVPVGCRVRLKVERHINNVGIDIWRSSESDDSVLEKLRETSRFVGNIARAARKNHSVSGKILPGLDADKIEAVKRCIREKIEIECDFQLVDPKPGQSPINAAKEFLVRHECPSKVCVLTSHPMYEEIDDKAYRGITTWREIDKFFCMVPQDALIGTRVVRKFGEKVIVRKWSSLTDLERRIMYEVRPTV